MNKKLQNLGVWNIDGSLSVGMVFGKLSGNVRAANTTGNAG
jgi:hypothetical protein